MANTYTQIHLQVIFAVKKRTGLIQKEWKDELYKYISGIIHAQGHKLLAINGIPDHLHIFFGMRPIQSLSDLMQEIKQGSSKWINNKNFIKDKFEWSRIWREIMEHFPIVNRRQGALLLMYKIKNYIIAK